MLKAFTPVAILLISFAFRIQEPNARLMLIVAVRSRHSPLSPSLHGASLTHPFSSPQMISVGCALAAYGELHFELVGFVCQCAAVAFEASRLVMIQILLHGMKMDPLVSLYYYAPVGRLAASGCGARYLTPRDTGLRGHQRLHHPLYRGA